MSSELQDLTEDSVVADEDLVYIVIDPTVTALSRKMSRQNFIGSFAITLGDVLLTIKDNKLKINSPDDADGVTIVNSDQTAERNLTIPVLTADDTIPVLGLAQTFTKTQTIDLASGLNLSLSNATSGAELLRLWGNAVPSQTFFSTGNLSQIGEISFYAKNSTPADFRYSLFAPFVVTNTAGVEDGQLSAYVARNSGITELLRIYGGANPYVGILSADLQIPATKKLFLDGGGDTYILESSANVLGVTVGNTEQLSIPTGALMDFKNSSLIVNAVSPTSPDRTISVKIGGTTYYIHAKTTND